MKNNEEGGGRGGEEAEGAGGKINTWSNKYFEIIIFPL